MFVNFKQVCGNMLMWQFVRVVRPVNGVFLFFRYNQSSGTSSNFASFPDHTRTYQSSHFL